jgi:uncharacterized membrane protein
MNKSQFLQELADALDHLPEEERKDILRDYQEYFELGIENGKTEMEITKSLGYPKQIAKELQTDQLVRNAEQNRSWRNLWKVLRSTIALSSVNVVLVFGTYLLGLFVLTLSWKVSVLLILSPFIWWVFDTIEPVIFFDFILYLTLIASGIGLLLAVPLWAVSRWFSRGFLHYVKFTMKQRKGGSQNVDSE